MDYKHACDTIYTHFWGITDNIYGFGRPFFAPSHIFTRPQQFLPVQMTGGWFSVNATRTSTIYWFCLKNHLKCVF